MSDHDPLYNHAAFVARLEKARESAPATIGDHFQDLDQLAARYDALAETMNTDAQILEAMRVPLRAAHDQGITAAAIYDALANVGLSISHAHFARILAKQKRTRHTASQAAMTAEQWVAVLAPVLSGASAMARYRAICAPLQDWGAHITATALRRAHLQLQQQQNGAPTSPPPWPRVLDQMASRLVDMARIGCNSADIAACLKRRHLPVPESDIAAWLDRTLHQQQHTHARRATQIIQGLLAKYSALGQHQLSVTVDPIVAAPFHVTVRCSDNDSASFARTWLDAGVRAIAGQLPPQTVQAEPAKPSSKAPPKPTRAARPKKTKKEEMQAPSRTRST